MLAARSGCCRVVEALIDAGVNVNLRNKVIVMESGVSAICLLA